MQCLTGETGCSLKELRTTDRTSEREGYRESKKERAEGVEGPTVERVIQRERERERDPLLDNSFSCCCRVMEALYVRKTLAVSPGIRELRCLFSVAV